MSRNSFYVVIVLAVMWVILREDISAVSALTGVIIGIFCVFFCKQLLPMPKSSNIKPLRLVVYLLFLFVEIYKAGVWAIKVVWKGSRTEVLDMKTEIQGQLSRTILANSITIVPGSISLELKDDTITVIWLAEKEKTREQTQETANAMIGKMERMLSKVQG